MLGRPSAAEAVQVTNFVGPMNGLSEVITCTCGGVRTHVSRIMTKLGARDRAQLVVLGYETGLVRPGWLA